MGKYLKLFETTSQYNAYTADTANFIKPNVSLITETNTVAYNPIMPPETRVVAKYNVTSTSSPIQIVYKTSGFSAIEIDGVAQPSVVSAYTFTTTGEHTVKFTLIDQTNIGEHYFTSSRALRSIDIPDNVTSIGYQAFWGCSGLTSVTIGSSITSIGKQAFMMCSVLTRLNSDTDGVYNLPSGITSISYGIFESCSSLTGINIPSGVTNIIDGAFYNCTSLSEITSNAMTAPTLPTSGQPVFSVASNGTLKVPTGSTGYDTWLTKLGSGWSIQYI